MFDRLLEYIKVLEFFHGAGTPADQEKAPQKYPWGLVVDLLSLPKELCWDDYDYDDDEVLVSVVRVCCHGAVSILCDRNPARSPVLGRFRRFP